MIDTKSMYCTEYEDRERIRTTAVGIDDETTREELLKTVEFLRSESTLESRAIEKQADEVIRIMELRFGYAEKEVASWFKGY